MITVYSTPTCPWCQKLKKYLDSHDIEYENINVQEDLQGREDMISISDQQSVPVIDIDGEVIVGFDKDKLDNLLNL